MSYHRGGQEGAVAVSYSTSPMAPYSPSRRCSSGSGGTSSSAIGGSTSKLNTYRSTGTSSILYTSEYRRSYCPSGSFYSSTGASIRRNYVSEYSRSRSSPTRSVSSTTYTSPVSSSAGPSTNATSSSSSRFGLSTSSSSSSLSISGTSRDRLESTTTDLSRYSPSGYIPNISGSSHHHHRQWKHHSTSTASTGSSLTELFGEGGRETIERTGRDYSRPESSLSSSSSSSSAAGVWSRSKRRPGSSSSTVLHGGYARADGAATPGEVTIDERGSTVRDHLDEDEDDDDQDEDGDGDEDEDEDEDEGDRTSTTTTDRTDDQHNNNNNVKQQQPVGGSNNNVAAAASSGENGNASGASGTEDSGGYGVVNNNDRGDLDDEDADLDDEDEGDAHLNGLHRRLEVSPAKRNLLSPTVAAASGGGGAGLIGVVKLDLLTNLATNTSNGELLINNNAREKISVTGELEKQPEELDIEEESLEDGDEQRNTSTSFVGGITPPILQNGVAGRPSGTYGDDPSAPSTSRRQEGHFSGSSTNTASNLTSSSPTGASTAHQSLYRGVTDQFEGSPTNKSARNRLQAHRDERCGLNGLRNIGNTCFMNSVIQCLSNTRPLLEYLLNEQYLADINTSMSGMKGALIKAFSQVIHELWEVGGDHVVNTTALKSQIQRFAPRFIGYSQQDAQEFLRYLLEGLHEDVNRVTVKPQPIHTDIPEMYTDSQKAVESWKRYLRSEDSMIVDVFVGQLRSSLHCTSCDHVSVTLDPFWDLSLPIPARSGTVKLSQCLEHFTREEVLDGDEKPTCSKCQMRRKCTKSFSIQKFPKILVIHLKRFSPMERFRSKLNVMVDFPLTGLDLSAFAAPRVPGCTYNLYGVANHSGTTHSGHYTAYCKHPYSGDWHEYNDSRVSVVPARSVVSNEAYVLFYEQQPHSSHL
ncbi:PREDICTED: serine-rich adhesin for platelets-like isoform X1 [Habropoda laboriosa]|uniref:serine-rich adhesin for platelets-like isoform X1 n=1 Tax=Habropoda laboriosa TaxID=597456 RepID=UPI00083DC508|nr:PREDICTED: serine-rich adhesin for platelets-like isoform X1 [Habropoda laboriosa]